MFSCFLSVVACVNDTDTLAQLEAFLIEAGAHLAARFSDYEIICVDNRSGLEFSSMEIPDATRNNCYVVALASRVSLDVGILAGFERANGDYAIAFDTHLAEHLDLIDEMYSHSQRGVDIVLLRDRQTARRFSIASALFFALIRRAANAKISPRDRKEVLVSRRALNSILRYRHRTAYLGEIYSVSGYSYEALEVAIPQESRRRTRSDRQRLAWAALARMTSFPLPIALAAIIPLVLGLFVLSANALSVRLFGVTLLGHTAVAVPGWTYLVILLSIGFLLTNAALYAILRMLLVIHDEVRNEPRYVVEAFRRL